MPLYLMHLREPTRLCRDHEGVILDDAEAARLQAVAAARNIMSHDVTCGSLSLKGEIDVGNETGVRLFTVRFRDALSLNS